MRKHGIGKMNDSRELFADLSSFNKLVIGGSIFPARRQDNVGFCRQLHRKPDCLHLHSIKVHKVFVVSKGKERGRYAF